MESRSGSIKDPIYYPSGSGDGASLTDAEIGTRSSGGSQELGIDESVALKVPRKFIANWRQACDRTRDRTKDLLKRWRTVPANSEEIGGQAVPQRELDHPSWSVHVWTTWVSRYPSDDSLTAIEDFDIKGSSKALAPIQRDKFSHFFTYLLDHDRDGFITRKDFSTLSERLRRFADWSWNGPEYLRLLEIEQGFANLILQDRKGNVDPDRKIDLDDWLSWWAQIVAPPCGASFNDLPFWIKTMPRMFFLVINRSGSGVIGKSELAEFYGSVVGFDIDRTRKCLDVAYSSMTSAMNTAPDCALGPRDEDNIRRTEDGRFFQFLLWRVADGGNAHAPRSTYNGDHLLGWTQYQLVFANFLFARGPFGPGEHFLGMTDACMIRGNSIPFPIDYSAMNTPKDKLEVYSPHCKSSRRSVVV